MSEGIPVLLVLGAVVGSPVSNPALEETEIPGVDGLSVVLLAVLDVVPAAIDFSERHAQWVGHEEQSEEEPANTRAIKSAPGNTHQCALGLPRI